MDLLQTILVFIVVISLIVFVHEYGHYFFARLFNVKVESFSIGFGREIWGFNDKNGTRWKFCIIPAGGYVKMFGDYYSSSLEGSSGNYQPTNEPYAFANKPLYQRSLIALGGPLANFLSAVLIIFSIYFFIGKTFIEPVVTSIIPDSPAEWIGIQVGDRIVEINGESINDFSELSRLVALNTEGDSIKLCIKRDGKIVHFELIPDMVEITDISGTKFKTARIGIASNLIIHRDIGFFDALLISFKDSVLTVKATATVLAQIISGNRDVKEMGGPIKIAQYSSKSWTEGWLSMLWLIASLSVNLAFINLLPIPVLDGGHILHNVIEKLVGRDRAGRIQNYSIKFGTLVVIALFAIITINDLISMFALR